MRQPTHQERVMAQEIINYLKTFATNDDVKGVAQIVARMRDAAYQQGKKDGAGK